LGLDHFNFLKVKVSFSNVPDSQIGSTPMLSNGGFAKCTLKQCAGQYCNANVWFRSMQCEAMQVHADQEQCTEVACKSFTPESRSFAQQISPSGLCLGSVYTARSRHRSPPPPPKTQNPPKWVFGFLYLLGKADLKRLIACTHSKSLSTLDAVPKCCNFTINAKNINTEKFIILQSVICEKYENVFFKFS